MNLRFCVNGFLLYVASFTFGKKLGNPIEDTRAGTRGTCVQQLISNLYQPRIGVETYAIHLLRARTSALPTHRRSMDAARPSTGGSRPTAGLSRKSSTKVTYAEDDIPAWTPEMEAELDNARAALKAAHKKWSPEQEHWYPEVRTYYCVKAAPLGGLSRFLQGGSRRSNSSSDLYCAPSCLWIRG